MYSKTLDAQKFARAFNAFSVGAMLLCAFALQSFAQSGQLTVREIMAEPSIAGMRPEGERLSPDGKFVAYLWSASGREPRDIYIVSTQGGAPRLLARAIQAKSATEEKVETQKREAAKREEAKQTDAQRAERMRDAQMQRDDSRERISNLEWSPDSRRILYAQNGDLFVAAIDEANARPHRLTKTLAPETGARWTPDGRAVIFQSNGQIFRLNLDSTELIQLTREGAASAMGANANANAQTSAPPNASNITNVILSENGARLAYLVSDTSKQRALIVPNYTGEFVVANAVRRGWSDQVIKIVDATGENEKTVTVKLPAPEGASYIRVFKWTPDDSALVVDRIDRDTKRRQLFYVNASDGNARLIDEETDAKWIAPLSRIVEISPDGKSVLFASERDGFNHLYLAPLERDSSHKTEANAVSEVKQLTRGAWEVNWAKFTSDGQRIIYTSTEKSTAERHFYILNLANGKTNALSDKDGMNLEPQLSKDGAIIVFQHSEWNAPTDLYAMQINANGASQAVRLTDAVPARFKQIFWTAPQFVEYKTKDGKTVKARIYLPPNFDKSHKYPAVVFVHGAGYLQNTINGWNNYYREAMFNSLLTQRGYVVLDADYRGSAGYGREWRTDVYDFLGGTDFQDELDGIDFVVANYSVDARRVGMYGGSYGGFMSEMAAMRAPERINCAAALRPVADWKNYYASSPIYTAERLGFPDKNAEAYRRSSPIYYADKLERPLLILHGMVDDNVHFQDTVQLVEKLIELGKTDYFEVMFYPKENHGFTKPESWTDEYERILKFFDAHLQKDK
jgi:dipeptidyl aminopeptidase/acylaminoacyl peptidase